MSWVTTGKPETPSPSMIRDAPSAGHHRPESWCADHRPTSRRSSPRTKVCGAMKDNRVALRMLRQGKFCGSPRPRPPTAGRSLGSSPVGGAIAGSAGTTRHSRPSSRRSPSSSARPSPPFTKRRRLGRIQVDQPGRSAQARPIERDGDALASIREPCASAAMSALSTTKVL